MIVPKILNFGSFENHLIWFFTLELMMVHKGTLVSNGSPCLIIIKLNSYTEDECDSNILKDQFREITLGVTIKTHSWNYGKKTAQKYTFSLVFDLLKVRSRSGWFLIQQSSDLDLTTKHDGLAINLQETVNV